MAILILIAILLVSISIVLYFINKKAFYKVIMDKRKTKDEMIKAMKERFSSDYEDYKNLEGEELTIRSYDGYKLKGYYYLQNKDSKKIAIIHHGYTANHYVCFQFADIFFEEGFNVLLIDMRSHGESEGEHSTYGYKEVKDLDKWVDLMREKVGKEGIIGLHGQSMGGATVLMYGGKHSNKIDFIIADCAYSNGVKIIKSQFKESKVPFFPVYHILNRKIKRICGFDMNKISPIDDIKNSDVPVMFVHGTSDELVPHSMSEEMYKVKKGDKNKLLLIQGAKHVGAYSKDKKLYKETVRVFIENVIKDKKYSN
ncbi:alpha/beta hydrolase [Clostridium chauvoei]|uniref:alpha/beta hydrolase n=1 Tax=Clostridium chauvoei TaxID=46867 RepID=UPI001C8556B9|nr:alpha/beta hydrolase [Clostridium chauvoei]MBX7407847.1 alpha/beta hydrolase [Clostridium chauvoei]